MKLSEDWMALIVGLVIVALVWVGILGTLPWPLIKF